jgi:hypothetical protein
MNFLNGERGQNASGEQFYITLGGDERAQKYVTDMFSNVIPSGLDRIHFLDPKLTDVTLGLNGGISCRAKIEGDIVDVPSREVAQQPEAEAAHRIDGRTTIETDGLPEEVAASVGRYLAGELGVDAAELHVKPLQGGRSGDGIYMVTKNGKDLGVFKIFGEPEAMATDVAMLKMVHDKNLSIYNVVGENGTVQIDTHHGEKGGLLMETAHGQSVEASIKALPPEGTAEHASALAALEGHLDTVARGMAEMHKAFADGSSESVANKQSDADYVYWKLERLGGHLGGDNLKAIESALDGFIFPMHMASDVPATAYHGDANAGNFLVDEHGRLTVIDVSTMIHSLDADGKGVGTGAVDLGRFMQAVGVASEGRMSPAEISRLQQSFLREYFAASGYSSHDFEYAILLSRLEFELALCDFATTKADREASLQRIGGLLRLELDPTKMGSVDDLHIEDARLHDRSVDDLNNDEPRLRDRSIDDLNIEDAGRRHDMSVAREGLEADAIHRTTAEDSSAVVKTREGSRAKALLEAAILGIRDRDTESTAFRHGVTSIRASIATLGVAVVVGIVANLIEREDEEVFSEGKGDRNSIDPDDVRQGALGDCYLLSAMAAIAVRNPDLLKMLVETVGEGEYLVKFYDPATGELMREVRVKNIFPLDENGQAMFAKPGDQGEMWVQLFEKAYASEFGGYGEIGEGGLSDKPFELLTGNDATVYRADSDYKTPTVADLINHWKAGDAVVASSLSKEKAAGPRYDGEEPDLVAAHAYYVTDVNEKDRTVTIRNPWGWDRGEVVLSFDEFEVEMRGFIAVPVTEPERTG